MGPGPSGGIFTRFVHHGLGRFRRVARGSSPSPRSAPASGASLDRIEHRDYSRMPGDIAAGTPDEDYSDEPPSNRTSTYPCIRLYGSTSRRMVNPAPFDRLVRPTYSGDAAHLEDVSKASRH